MTTSARTFARPYRASISVEAPSISIAPDLAVACGILAVVLVAIIVCGVLYAGSMDELALRALVAGR